MSEQSQGAKQVEILQLVFLQVLPSYLPTTDYAVKGGANLRLFYESRRRSQDIDFDYLGDRFHDVESKVDKALSSRALRDILRVAGVTMSDPTKPEQTDTTRRWKFSVAGTGGQLNTKIEFSVRGVVDPEHAFEAVRNDIGRSIGLRVVKAEHYLPPASIRQKIRALAHRSATEPRDVFDLDLLFGSYPDALKPGGIDAATLKRAEDAALAIPYEAYSELVVDYIEDDFVEIYGRPEVWTAMVLGVVERLEALQ
ncbi:MAG TPA: nucleotidyl transferase AbiEii/AbiGii toxin family protein [Candidatus Limnocylindrales bacterium]